MTLLSRSGAYLLPFALLAIVLFGASAVNASSAQDTAYDERGGIPVNNFGKCVRTKWMGDNDPCAPEAPPAPAPAPQAAPAPAPAPVVKLEQRTIYFDFDKADLTMEGVEKLSYLAQVINGSSAIADVVIVGYADEIGTSSYNQKLSEARVATVKAFLDQRSRMDTKVADIRALGSLSNMPECKGLPRTKRIECLQPQRKVEIEFKYQPR